MNPGRKAIKSPIKLLVDYNVNLNATHKNGPQKALSRAKKYTEQG